MKKKPKVRTAAQRSAAAREAWVRRRAGANGVAAGPPAIDYPGSFGEEFSATFTANAGSFPEPVEGYEMLSAELSSAYVQSAWGKGKERHANGRPFNRQPIMENGRMFGPGFTAGQSAKKAQEAMGMLSRGDNARALAEIHGAIVYLAATAALIRELPPAAEE